MKNKQNQEADFINVRRMIASKNPKLLKWIPGFVIRYIERILHQDEINNFLKTHDSVNQQFCTEVINHIEVSHKVKGIENIPKTGKCVIVMNHPLGGMDAMLFIDALKEHRTDVRFIVNDLLLNLGRLNDLFVGVNKVGKSKSQSLQKVNQLFETEHCVCIFPSGMVSRRSKGVIRDLMWRRTFVKLSKQNDQTIIPIHIEGRLTNWFYRLSNFRRFIGIKMNIEMLYLSDEMFKQKGQCIEFTVGKPIHVSELPEKSDEEIAEWFRNHIYTLKEQK